MDARGREVSKTVVVKQTTVIVKNTTIVNNTAIVRNYDRGHYGFIDSAGARNDGTQLIVCEMTVRKGAVAWDLNGRASQDWKTFSYHKERWTH